jgi:ribonucleoside-diphosphate reductase alpha chain
MSWVLIVTDGETIRTVHPPSLPAHVCEAVGLWEVQQRQRQPQEIDPEKWVNDVRAMTPALPAEVKESVHQALKEIRVEQAKATGKTGDICPTCGSFNMVRTGSCVTCQDCGNNSGCG